MFVILSTLGFSQSSIGPINISMPSSPSVNVADWAKSTPPITIVAQTKGSSQGGKVELDCKMLVSIKNDGNKICGLYNPQTAPNVTFNSTIKTWSGSSVLSLLGSECTLKPGNYEFCVQFFDINSQIIGESCKPFSIAETKVENYTLSQNIGPVNEKQFSQEESKSPITLRWTPILPKPSSVFYKVKLFEIKSDQSISQATKTESFLLEKEVKNQTQLIIPNISVYPISEGSKYGWYVEAEDENGKLLGKGHSEPTSFGIDSPPPPPSLARVSGGTTFELIFPEHKKIFTPTELSNPISFSWTDFSLATNEEYQIQIKRADKTSTNIIKVTHKLNYHTISASDLDLSDCSSSSPCQFLWSVEVFDKVTGEINQTSQFSFSSKNAILTTSDGTGGSTTTSSTSTTSGDSTEDSSTSSPCGTDLKVNDKIKLSDNFELTLTEVPTGTCDSLVGKGTVKVKWLGNLKVQFDGIGINTSKELISGTVYTVSDPTQSYPNQWASAVLGIGSLGSWTAAKIKSVADKIQLDKISKPLIEAANEVTTLSTTPLIMPVGYFQNGDEANAMGFTEMRFDSVHAEFDVIASLKTTGIFKEGTTFSGTEAISLTGTKIKFTEGGLKAINGEIKLIEPITFSYADGLNITFNIEDEEEGHIGNGIMFSDTIEHYWKYKFDANIQLPSEWLIPVDPEEEVVDLNFQMQIVNWDDFIMEATLPACTIANTNGAGLEVGNIVFDHSKLENYSDIEFPENYEGETSEMFTGFYLKTFKLTLPDQLRTYEDTLKKIEVGSENLIINRDGITAKIFANNVINYPKANVGNLGASIDTVSVQLLNSTLTEAQILGKITLPMSSSEEVGNAINYVALFIPSAGSDDSTSRLSFTLKPENDIKSRFLGDGKVEVSATSSLELILAKNSSKERTIDLSLDLNGKVYYPTGKILDPGASIPLDLDLSCNFEHLGMTYKKNNTEEDFDFSVGHWSFASPPKKLAGFAFTITDVKPKIEPVTETSEKQYLFKGGVEFVAKINIGSDKVAISGDVKIDLVGAVVSSNYYSTELTSLSGAKENYGFLTTLKPIFVGVRVQEVNVDIKLASAEIKGHVEFKKNDPVYGNAFLGDLTVKFTTLNLGVQAGAIFGNTKYKPGYSGPGFKYWMVQAQVNLPPPGIPFLTGVAFRGFGAGVYSRMNMTPPVEFNPTEAASSTFGGAVFTPDITVSMGFRAKAIIATTPKEETFNGSIALGAEFNSSGGINFIQFNGLFNCGAEIGKESEAFANGSIDVSYNFPKKIFNMTCLLKINKDPIYSTGDGISTVLQIDGLKNKWYFMSGTPTIPNEVHIGSKDGLGISSYFMFGNDIEIPTGFMQQTRDGFADLGYDLPNFTDNATSDNKYQSAKGFAFGLGVHYQKTGEESIVSFHGDLCDCDRYLNIDYYINAGGEVDASLLQYTGCEGFGKGWRAKLSMAVYAGAGISYSYSLPIVGSNSGHLGSVRGSFYATAEFPKPSFLQGELNGDFELCGYDIGFHKDFQFGEQCGGSVVSETTPAYVYTQENVSDSLSYTLIKNIVTPGTNSGISRTTEMAALLNYPYNEPFDLEEQQASGEIKVRTFRALYTTKLTKDSLYTGPLSASSAVTMSSSLMVAETSSTSSSSTAALPGSAALPPSSSVVTTSVITPGPSKGGSKPSVSTSTVLASSTVVPPKGSGTSTSTSGTAMAPSSSLGTAAAAFIDNSIELKAMGYDVLGANVFKIKALVEEPKINAPINALKANTSYKFFISGELQENIDGVWKTVNRKVGGSYLIPIKQQKYYYFKTNSEVVDDGKIKVTTGVSSSPKF